jgi:hypothetical protein
VVLLILHSAIRDHLRNKLMRLRVLVSFDHDAFGATVASRGRLKFITVTKKCHENLAGKVVRFSQKL